MKNKKLILSLSILVVLSMASCTANKQATSETTKAPETTVTETTKAPETTASNDISEYAYSPSIGLYSSMFPDLFDKYQVNDKFDLPKQDFSLSGVRKTDDAIVFYTADNADKIKGVDSSISIVTKLPDGGYLLDERFVRNKNEEFVVVMRYGKDGNGLPVAISTTNNKEGETIYSLGEILPGSDATVKTNTVKAADGSINKTVSIIDNLGYTVFNNTMNIKTAGNDMTITSDIKNEKDVVIGSIKSVQTGKNVVEEFKDIVSGKTVVTKYTLNDDGIDPDSVESSVLNDSFFK